MTAPTTPSEEGFVRRGFYLLIGMGLMAALVLAILFGKPGTSKQQAAGFDIEGVAESAKGWKIRYSAAISLARRGADRVPWDTFAEMLDEKQQLRNFTEGGTDVSAARSQVLRALSTIEEWHSKRSTVTPDAELEAVYARVDELARESKLQVRGPAQKTLEAVKPYRKS